MRIAEQNMLFVAVDLALPKLNVKIFSSSCGFSDAGDGATHQSVEDIAIMELSLII